MRTFEHGGNIHRLQRAAVQPLVDFSANINPLGLATSVQRAMAESIEEVIHYPDVEGRLLKQAIADHYWIDYESITLGNGAVELLYVLCHLLRPRKVLIPEPSFSEYERAASAVGAEIDYYMLSAENGFAINTEVLADVLSGHDMVFIGNPNNPTGTLLTLDDLKVIATAAQKGGTWVVVDESFVDFLVDREQYTVKSLLKAYPHIIALHSLTKFYAIPGLRLGFAATSSELAERMHKAKDPWNVNHLAQVAGVAALNDVRYQSATRVCLHKERAVMTAKLESYKKLKVFTPTVNFVLVDISATGLRSSELTERCFQKGILIRDCANYPGLTDKYVRFAIKSADENEKLYAALDQIIGGMDND